MGQGARDMMSGQAVNAASGMFAGRRLFIFDFDGTIANTTPLHAAAFAQVLSPLGVVVDYDTIAGLRTSDAVRRLLASAGIERNDMEVKSLAASKQSAVRAMMANALEPLPGADIFLRRARQTRAIALVTSGSRGTVELALHSLGYAGWFSPVICSDDVARAKPDPEGFLRTLALTGVPAGEAIVFEDSRAGMAAARAACLDAIDVTKVDWNELLRGLD